MVLSMLIFLKRETQSIQEVIQYNVMCLFSSKTKLKVENLGLQVQEVIKYNNAQNFKPAARKEKRKYCSAA